MREKRFLFSFRKGRRYERKLKKKPKIWSPRCPRNVLSSTIASSNAGPPYFKPFSSNMTKKPRRFSAQKKEQRVNAACLSLPQKNQDLLRISGASFPYTSATNNVTEIAFTDNHAQSIVKHSTATTILFLPCRNSVFFFQLY